MLHHRNSGRCQWIRRTEPPWRIIQTFLRPKRFDCSRQLAAIIRVSVITNVVDLTHSRSNSVYWLLNHTVKVIPLLETEGSGLVRRCFEITSRLIRLLFQNQQSTVVVIDASSSANSWQEYYTTSGPSTSGFDRSNGSRIGLVS